MQHRFDSENLQNLQGTWFKDNGRRFCGWRFDADERILKSGRGVVVHSMPIDVQELVSGSTEKLLEELPQLALALACEGTHRAPLLH